MRPRRPRPPIVKDDAHAPATARSVVRGARRRKPRRSCGRASLADLLRQNPERGVPRPRTSPTTCASAAAPSAFAAKHSARAARRRASAHAVEHVGVRRSNQRRAWPRCRRVVRRAARSPRHPLRAAAARWRPVDDDDSTARATTDQPRSPVPDAEAAPISRGGDRVVVVTAA